MIYQQVCMLMHARKLKPLSLIFLIVPSEPRNISLVVKGNTINVTWQPPKYRNGEFRHYTVLWKKTGLGEKYIERNTSSRNLIITDLRKLGFYDIHHPERQISRRNFHITPKLFLTCQFAIDYSLQQFKLFAQIWLFL